MTGRVRGYPILAVLNDRWRVVDEGLQWMLQVRTGRPTKKSTGWRNRCFHLDRTALFVSIREHCGNVHADALAVLRKLPERYIERR